MTVSSKLDIDGKTIELIEGDVTNLETDAIVNAANQQLKLGAGVAGAIRRRGGPAIQAECDRIGYCPVGGAVLTTGGNLPARHVIHAVGPVFGEGEEDDKLRNATLSSLRVADENGLTSVAFPAISTGVFGFPIDRCAGIMLGAVREYLQGETGLARVVFCLFGAEAYGVFEDALDEIRTDG